MLNLEDCNDKTCVNNTVNNIAYLGGDDNLAAALDLARTSVFNSARKNALKVALVVTDYIPSPPINQGLEVAIYAAKDVGIKIYGVGINIDNAIYADTFYRMSYNDGHYKAIWVGDYSQLNNHVIQAVRYVDQTGPDEVPTTRPTTTTTATTTTTTTTTPTTTTTDPASSTKTTTAKTTTTATNNDRTTTTTAPPSGECVFNRMIPFLNFLPFSVHNCSTVNILKVQLSQINFAGVFM
jgi:hypothetical protein